jgi:hypothetical protein
MSRRHDTYCGFQIGDTLIHLHFLRKLSENYPNDTFFHGVNVAHIPQMIEVIEDRPNIHLIDYRSRPANSLHVWKNDRGFWEHHALRDSHFPFHIQWFDDLSRRMGVENPFFLPEHLAFDYPALLKPTPLSYPFDALVVNSAPCSGQFRAYLSGPGGCNNPEYMTPLIDAMAKRHSVIVTQRCSAKVPCSLDYGISCTGIGNLSLFCKYIICISTGPSWPTFNVWNWKSAQLRLVLLDRENVQMAPNTVEVGTLEHAMGVLTERGLI